MLTIELQHKDLQYFRFVFVIR